MAFAGDVFRDEYVAGLEHAFFPMASFNLHVAGKHHNVLTSRRIVPILEKLPRTGVAANRPLPRIGGNGFEGVDI